MIFLYVLFGLSIFCPIYTYAVYPVILKFLKKKTYQTGNDRMNVSVVVVGNQESAGKKIENIQKNKYPDLQIVVADSITEGVKKTTGGIIVFTDTETELAENAIEELVKGFADPRIDCVVGQQSSKNGNSAFWKYENKVKELESNIGCVSGANDTIFAVRKDKMPIVDEKVKHKPFYIATSITQAGADVVYTPKAIAYEIPTEGDNFAKHVEDAKGYWQALRLFPKMLIGRHGSFVYVSHRVMKWFVWLNMIVMLVTSGVLAINGSILMAVLFGLQIVGYAVVMLLGKRNIGGAIGKLISIGYYFVMLNVTYMIAIIKGVSE